MTSPASAAVLKFLLLLFKVSLEELVREIDGKALLMDSTTLENPFLVWSALVQSGCKMLLASNNVGDWASLHLEEMGFLVWMTTLENPFILWSSTLETLRWLFLAIHTRKSFSCVDGQAWQTGLWPASVVSRLANSHPFVVQLYSFSSL